MVRVQLEETMAYIRSQTLHKPKIGVILGSGLGAFIDQIRVDMTLPYDEIPSFVSSSPDNRKGQLILGHVEDVPVAVLQGRVHYYEGHSMEQVVFPTRTLAMLGIETLVLTNSAGGLDPSMRPGDFMIVDDHINMMGENPLMGPNLKQLGPRFPDMTEAYDRKLNDRMAEIMSRKSIRHWRGVYCAVSGPTYETPAEVRFLQIIGAKAVGMSSVPEVIAANHLGLRVCAISCISNLASGLSGTRLSHEEVTKTAREVESKFCGFLKEFIGQEK